MGSRKSLFGSKVILKCRAAFIHKHVAFGKEKIHSISMKHHCMIKKGPFRLEFPPSFFQIKRNSRCKRIIIEVGSLCLPANTWKRSWWLLVAIERRIMSRCELNYLLSATKIWKCNDIVGQLRPLILAPANLFLWGCLCEPNMFETVIGNAASRAYLWTTKTGIWLMFYLKKI